MKKQIYNNEAVTSVVVPVWLSRYRLDQVLTILLSRYSRSQIKYWILNEKVIVNNKVSVLPKKKMIGGEVIEIKNIDKYSAYYINIPLPQDIPLDVIYEDNDILVINKPSNMVMHPGSGNYKNTVLNALLHRYPSSLRISQRAGIVHRLDKDTTGVMIIAKTCIAYNKLCQMFKTRKIIKQYDAVVFGNFSNIDGTINKPIRRHAVKRTCMTVHTMGKPAITHYSVVDTFNMYSRVRIYIKTGRTHQIRVHMAHINHPLIGDQKYGNFSYINATIGISDELKNCLNYFNRQALHACMLQLLHPITQVQMQWKAPLPYDMLNLINILKKNR